MSNYKSIDKHLAATYLKKVENFITNASTASNYKPKRFRISINWNPPLSDPILLSEIFCTICTFMICTILITIIYWNKHLLNQVVSYLFLIIFQKWSTNFLLGKKNCLSMHFDSLLNARLYSFYFWTAKFVFIFRTNFCAVYLVRFCTTWILINFTLFLFVSVSCYLFVENFAALNCVRRVSYSQIFSWNRNVHL